MADLVFITGNQKKADYLALWLGMPVEHRKLDLYEIQSLDPGAVVDHKVSQAYEIIKAPVLVEDVSLAFTAMGRLPGTLIKWFLEEKEIGNEGLCLLADGLANREAVATITYGYFDGNKIRHFVAQVRGTVADKPRGEHGMGWDPIMVPEGSTKTYGEMTTKEMEPFSVRLRAIEKLRAYLETV